MARARRTPGSRARRAGAACVLIPLAPLAAVVPARSAATAQEPTFSVRDSAGVRIIHNHIALEELPTLRLASEPRLRIGVLEGQDPYMFDRVSGIATLSDGRIAVLNWGTSEVRVFDAGGRFLFAVGGPGEGPGEFRRLAGVFRRPGDTLVVYDGDLQRITRVAPDGTVLDVRRLEVRDRPPLYVRGLFADGSMLAVAASNHDVRPDGFRSSFVHLRYGPDASLTDSLGSYPAGRFERRAERFFEQPLFQPTPVDAALPDGYLAASGDAYRFQVHGMDGRPIRSVRWEGPDLTVDEAAVDRFWEERMAGLDDAQRRALQDRREATSVSERFPALTGIEVTLSGETWVRAFERPGARTQEWLVFDADGVLRARAEFPPSARFYPREIDDSRVAGVLRDDLGVEYVAIYDLIEVPPER